MAVEVRVLENFGQEATLRKKWLKMWETLGVRILKLPKWMQDIVLEDVNTAIRNRIATMEMIQNANRKN
ncbi:hypothetical protein G4O51_09545 [Candidatus Bathyarchaeota archaeon A05DMB-2]|nr:hypothetical protein [Candidatus Bathyarchaeota archaeon A05DMB-2]